MEALVSLFKKYLSLTLNILFCTVRGSIYGCGREDGSNFEELKDNWEEKFNEEPEMNGGCVRTTGPNPVTYCFCDSDGCNAPFKAKTVGLMEHVFTFLSAVCLQFFK